MSKLPDRAANVSTSLKVLGGAGIIRPYGPRTLAGLGKTVRPLGDRPGRGFMTPRRAHTPTGSGWSTSSASSPSARCTRRSNALARGLAGLGVKEGDSVAVMCRNHRGFVDATIAVAKLGADILYLNTAFAGPQLVDVLEREKPAVVVHDEEFTELLGRRRRRPAA